MKTSQLGINLITHYESIHDGNLTKIGLQPKMDCSGLWTIGYGHLLTDFTGNPLSGVDGFTKLTKMYPEYLDMTIDEAEALLAQDLAEREAKLNCLNLNLKQYEFDALVSFVFNCGFRNFEQSRLLRMVKTRIGDIENAFSLWNKSGGKVLPGLTARRKSEWVLFSTGELKFFN